jgi:class 3 adenylate cyclase
MAANDIAAWLHELGLERYQDAFRANDIDIDVLPDLGEPDLERLGVSLGHRKKLLKAIAALATADPARSAEPPSGIRPAHAGERDAERRQVTALFCDLADYTALTRDLGAETMHALTGRFFERVDGIIEGYGGTIDKHIGDCVMAVFGAPRAHGNDPERAIRAALEIRAALPALSQEIGREIRTHIGIASGQIVASGTAGDRRFSITGDSVNLASRLTDAAEPGAILIAEGVRAALAERLDCAPAGRLAIKGFAEPVTAWRLEGLRERAGGADRPFVGRRAELAQFEAVLQTCLKSGTGQTICLRGEAGIGKTRLVEEFQRRTEAMGFACHIGLVLEFRQRHRPGCNPRRRTQPARGRRGERRGGARGGSRAGDR